MRRKICKISKKFLVTGAINKFDGHIFTFDFKNKKTPCIRSFFQEKEISDEILNCEYEGILGTVAGIIGTLQANEILKKAFISKIYPFKENSKKNLDIPSKAITREKPPLPH